MPTGNFLDTLILGGQTIDVAGTGFVHVTTGAMDGTARAVDLDSPDVTGKLGLGSLDQAGASTDDVMVWTGAAWEPAAIGSIDAGTAGQVFQTKAGSPATSTWGSAATVPLEFFGATGTSDDGPVIQSAIDAVSAGSVYRKGLTILVTATCTVATAITLKTGAHLDFGPGTFTLNAGITQQAFTRITGSACNTIFTSSVTGTFPLTGSIIRAGASGGSAGSSTLSSDVTRGTNVMHVTSATGATSPGWLFISSASTGYSATFKIDHISGTTLTLDRAVLQPFVSTDPVTYYAATSIPEGCELDGVRFNAATAIVAVSYQTAYRPRVTRCIFDGASSSKPSDAFGIFNTGTFGGYIADCYFDGYTGGSPAVSLGFQACDSCVGERCYVMNGAGYGIGLIESWNSGFRDCWVSQCTYGYIWQNDVAITTHGSDYCFVDRCAAVGCSADGFFIDWGANHASITNCLAFGNTGVGYNIDGTGAPSKVSLISCRSISNTGGPWTVASGSLGVEMIGMYIDGNVGAASHAGNVSIVGLNGGAASGANAFIHLTAGTTTITDYNITHTGGGAAGVFLIGGGKLRLRSGLLTMSVTGDIGVWMQSGAADVSLQNTVFTVSGGGVTGTYGLYNQSGTAEISDSDASGCANTWVAAGGTIGERVLTNVAEYIGGNGATAPIIADFSTSTAPTIRTGTAATSFALGTNKSGAAMHFEAGAELDVLVAQNPSGSIVNMLTLGQRTVNQVSKATNYTIDSSGAGDDEVWVTAVATITLPQPTPGRKLSIIINYDPTVGGGTIARHASELINGAASNITLGATDKYSILFATTNGVDWVIKGAIGL
jgi:hypothetical protein